MIYKVTGNLPYNDHPPGAVFEATLDPAAELRAIERGNIRIIDSSRTRLRPGSYRLPDGWLTRDSTSPARGFSFEGSNP